MASLTYRGTDLSAYGLIVTRHDIPMNHGADSVQLQDRSFAGDSKILPKTISLDIVISAADAATLTSRIDSIKRLLNTQIDEELILDALNDRYWLARFSQLSGVFLSADVFKGTLDFICFDPFAYAVAPSSDATAIANAVADNAVIFTGGNALIRPVYTILSDAIRVGTNVILHSDNTDEEIEWTGNLANGTVLVFDTALWVVKKNTVEDMATVDGQFPTLVQDTTNLILTAGFTGTLTVTWRNRYC